MTERFMREWGTDLTDKVVWRSDKGQSVSSWNQIFHHFIHLWHLSGAVLKNLVFTFSKIREISYEALHLNSKVAKLPSPHPDRFKKSAYAQRYFLEICNFQNPLIQFTDSNPLPVQCYNVHDPRFLKGRSPPPNFRFSIFSIYPTTDLFVLTNLCTLHSA